jgi:hypothetical protein
VSGVFHNGSRINPGPQQIRGICCAEFVKKPVFALLPLSAGWTVAAVQS